MKLGCLLCSPNSLVPLSLFVTFFIFWVLSPLFVCADNFRLSMEYWQLLKCFDMRRVGCSYWEFMSILSLFEVCGTVFHALFFPRVVLLCSYKEPQPKNPRRPHTTGPKPYQLKTPTPKTQSKTPTPQPQTTINEQNKKKIKKNKTGKKFYGISWKA